MLSTPDQREVKLFVWADPIEPNAWPFPWLVKVFTRSRAAVDPALGLPSVSGVRVLNSERLRGRLVTKSGWLSVRVPPLTLAVRPVAVSWERISLTPAVLVSPARVRLPAASRV